MVKGGEGPAWITERRDADQLRIKEYMTKLDVKQADIREREEARKEKNRAGDEARLLRFREADAKRF